MDTSSASEQSFISKERGSGELTLHFGLIAGIFKALAAPVVSLPKKTGEDVPAALYNQFHQRE